MNVYSASKLIQPVDTTRAEQPGGISPAVHSVLAVYFLQRNLAPAMTAGDGVSTYLALIFGTLLSSQGTDASFVLTLSGFPPGFPFGLAFPTLSDRFPIRFPVSGICRRSWAFACRPFDIHYVSGFPRQLIIEFREFEFRHADTPNSPSARESRK